MSYQPKRPGFTAFEAIAAVAILAVLLAIAGQMSGAMLRHRRSVERYRIAMDAKTNLMSIAMALPYDELTADRLKTIAAEFTPERASWEILVAAEPWEDRQEDEELAPRGQAMTMPLHTAKRIAIALRFAKGSLPYAQKRPLVAWRYRSDQLTVNPDGHRQPVDRRARPSSSAVPASGEER